MSNIIESVVLIYEKLKDIPLKKLYFITPFYVWGLPVSRLQHHYKETVYFLPLSPREALVLI